MEALGRAEEGDAVLGPSQAGETGRRGRGRLHARGSSPAPRDLQISSERAPTRVDLFTGASRKPNKTPRASESKVPAKLRPRAHLQRPCSLRGPRAHRGAQDPQPLHDLAPPTSPTSASCAVSLSTPHAAPTLDPHQCCSLCLQSSHLPLPQPR